MLKSDVVILFFNVIGNHGLIYTIIVIVRFVFKTDVKRIINHSEVLRIIVLLSRVFSPVYLREIALGRLPI